MATPQNRRPTAKESRADKRAAQLEAFKKKEAQAKRNRLLGILAAVLALVLVGGGVTAVFLVSLQPEPAMETQVTPEDLTTGAYEDRVQRFDGLTATHVGGDVEYDPQPPVGGDHDPRWLNCGVYSQEQRNENAVHALEHGAVWFTYDPEFTTDEEIAALRTIAPVDYYVISPYRGVGEAMAVSAWGAQLRFTDIDDPAITEFLTEYWKSPSGPEPGAPCTGGVTGPGLVQ